MRSTTKTETNRKAENRLAVNSEELQAMLGCGRMAAREIGEKAQAKVKVGRRTLWNVAKVQTYLNTVCM